jgi:hypothetical protein
MLLKRTPTFTARPPQLEDLAVPVDNGCLPPSIFWVAILGENAITNFDVIPVGGKSRARGLTRRVRLSCLCERAKLSIEAYKALDTNGTIASPCP